MFHPCIINKLARGSKNYKGWERENKGGHNSPKPDFLNYNMQRWKKNWADGLRIKCRFKVQSTAVCTVILLYLKSLSLYFVQTQLMMLYPLITSTSRLDISFFIDGLHSVLWMSCSRTYSHVNSHLSGGIVFIGHSLGVNTVTIHQTEYEEAGD